MSAIEKLSAAVEWPTLGSLAPWAISLSNNDEGLCDHACCRGYNDCKREDYAHQQADAPVHPASYAKDHVESISQQAQYQGQA